MTDDELIEMLRQRSATTLFDGVILEHCWLHKSAKWVEDRAGSWQVPITVEELEHLLDIAMSRRPFDESDY